MYKYYWLAVEADEYELPLAVADTAKELGDIFGISKSVVIDAIKNNRSTSSKMEQVEDEPQAGEMMTEEEFDSMLARVLTGNNEPQTERSE